MMPAMTSRMPIITGNPRFDGGAPAVGEGMQAC
jgi:hypothetical protein